MLELARAIEELRCEGVEMTTEPLRHLSTLDEEHIGLTGDCPWDFTARSSRAWLSVQNSCLLHLTKRVACKKQEKI